MMLFAPLRTVGVSLPRVILGQVSHADEYEETMRNRPGANYTRRPIRPLNQQLPLDIIHSEATNDVPEIHFY